MEHWIVVADRKACRIYRSDELLRSFEVVVAFDNEQVHADRDNLGPRGATQAGPGGARSAFDRHSDPEDMERARFARRVGAALEDGWTRRQWERAILVCPPAFLGDLRSQLTERVSRQVVSAIPHDLVKTPTAELPEAIRRHLPDLAGLDLP